MLYSLNLSDVIKLVSEQFDQGNKNRLYIACDTKRLMNIIN